MNNYYIKKILIVLKVRSGRVSIIFSISVVFRIVDKIIEKAW